MIEAPSLSRMTLSDDPALFASLTVWEHLVLTAQLYDLAGWEERATALLSELELSARRDDLADELSRGMRQKLCVACALLHEPGALLLDEPLIGLDPRGIRTLYAALRRQAAAGAAVVVSSHLLAQIDALCTRFLVLREGRLLPELHEELSRTAIALPPLRERPGDVEILARHFLVQFGACRDVVRIADEVLDRFARHAWPGNVGELRDCIDQACARAHGPAVELHRARLTRDNRSDSRQRQPLMRGEATTRGKQKLVILAAVQRVIECGAARDRQRPVNYSRDFRFEAEAVKIDRQTVGEIHARRGALTQPPSERDSRLGLFGPASKRTGYIDRISRSRRASKKRQTAGSRSERDNVHGNLRGA